VRSWLIALVFLAAVPAWGDTRFRAAPAVSSGVPLGKGQCDIRLRVDGEVEVAVRRDMVDIRTLSGRDARNDGSECNFPLPDGEPRGFGFQVVEARNEMRLVEPPSPRNDFAAIVRIRDSAAGFGSYHFRLSWDAPPAQERRGPAGFAWNNVTSFKGRGQGESRLNETSQRLADVSVDIDRGAKIVVSFLTERGRGAGRARRVLFTGTVIGREETRLRADIVTEDGRLHGTMLLSVDDRQNVNGITLEATDGHDHLHLKWDRQ
jgi:hypothetical protein